MSSLAWAPASGEREEVCVRLEVAAPHLEFAFLRPG